MLEVKPEKGLIEPITCAKNTDIESQGPSVDAALRRRAMIAPIPVIGVSRKPKGDVSHLVQAAIMEKIGHERDCGG